MTVETLENLISEPFDTLVQDIRKVERLASFYRAIYGSDACIGCGGIDTFRKYYSRIKEEGLQIMKNRENSTFLLKKSISARPMKFGSNVMVSNANLTDELAIEFLQINPNRISLFEKYPENWRELIGIFSDEQAAGDEDGIAAHVVTQDELDENPELAEAGVNAGDEVEIPADAIAEKPAETKSQEAPTQEPASKKSTSKKK